MTIDGMSAHIVLFLYSALIFALGFLMGMSICKVEALRKQLAKGNVLPMRTPIQIGVQGKEKR